MEEKIVVKALPVEEIIKDLSQQWQVPITQDSGEQMIFLPSRLGKGYVRGISFSSGVGLIQYKCTFYQDYEIHFSKMQIHPLKFIFCSKGIVQHSFQDEPQFQTVHAHQNVIVSSEGKKGHVLFFKANQECHVTSIEIIREVFASRNNYEFKDLDSDLKMLFEDLEARKGFLYQGNYSLKSAEIVEAIEQMHYKGFLRYIFLDAKIREMLVLQIVQYQDDQREDAPQIIRRSELDKIGEAAKIINENLDRNYSVQELAEIVGTNVNKLQEGFKIIFDSTVNKYAQHQKFEAAQDLLESNEFNISEIVNKIGLSNRSYFSKIFREKYGVSPSYFRGQK